MSYAGLGWRQDLEPADRLHETARPFAFTGDFNPPDEITHDWLKIENQGQMGSCAGQAMATLQEILWFLSTGETVQLSRMFAYLMAQRHCGLFGRDVGATITGAVDAAKQAGNCLETVFPYPPRYTTAIPPAAPEEARKNLVKEHAILRSYDDCFRWLAGGVGGIEIGISWTRNLANNRSGIVEFNDIIGTSLGGHALALIGYTKRLDRKKRNYLLMINSHGEQWGKNGRAEVSPDSIEAWTQDRHSEVIGIRDLTGPAAQRNLPTYVGSNLIG